MAAIARGAIAEIWQRLHDVAGLERRWIWCEIGRISGDLNALEFKLFAPGVVIFFDAIIRCVNVV